MKNSGETEKNDVTGFDCKFYDAKKRFVQEVYNATKWSEKSNFFYSQNKFLP